MSDAGAPIAWLALDTGTPIYSSDGEEVGKVADIIADREKDIFSGITFRPGLLETPLFISATAIESLAENEVRLSLTAAETEKLEPYEG
ncbi:MAG TPA: PRC-barrel domain-containing protein [Actinomycetota bacterium]|nr:PRC-barrel domain-containing protein [Actinomycetota bacterium]